MCIYISIFLFIIEIYYFKIFPLCPINIIYFGRVGGGLLLQQIRILQNSVNSGLHLSLFIYSINKKLKIQNINNKKKKYVQETIK